MLYTDFILKAKELVIIQNEDNGMWYLEPEWRLVLNVSGLKDLRFSDFRADWFIIEDNLKLEVEKRNLSVETKKQKVIDWLHETITMQIEPAIMQEETDYIKQVVEFMKANHQLDSALTTGDYDGDEVNVVQDESKDTRENVSG